MSAANAALHGRSGPGQESQSGGTAWAPTADKIQAKFELGVSIALFNWSALGLAVQNQWGGSDSEGKREWFVGAIIQMFEDRPQTELEDVESTLLQVMLDEFDVNVDDDTAYQLAEQIMRFKKMTLVGDFIEVDKLHESWLAKKGRSDLNFQRVDRAEDDDETDWDTDDSEDEEEEDVEMVDASAAAHPVQKEKQVPKVDEDGFTEVVGKKKR
ncbi:MAG: hypothetical protein M1837_001601 [Sclerophora amabilis]|nr:MAG: hypothetical protein M1837_001601 [Sclerophora amabilis]